MAPEDSASGDDAEPDDEWKSSLRELADRIRNEKRISRTAESTPASDWSPNITAEERSDTGSTTNRTTGFEFGYTASADESEREETDSTTTDEPQEPPQDESSDREIEATRDDGHTHTDRSVSQSETEQPSADSADSVVEALGDVKTAVDEPSEGDETASAADTATHPDDQDPDDDADPPDLGPDTDTQQADDEGPSLGEIGASDEAGAATPPPSDGESGSHSTGGAASGQTETETPTESGMGVNTFGELADRMAASREKNASSGKTDRNNTDRSEADDGPPDDTPSQSGESSRQLPLGANEPEFSTDLSPLVQPNMSAMLLGGLKSAPVDQACGRLLTFPDGREYNLLLVTVTQSAEDRLLTVYENSEGLPENIGVVAIDNNVSAQNTTQTIPVGGVDRTVHMKTATDPGDIKGIGIRISKQLSEWDNNDRPTMVCFHSLTSILQYISTKQLFQFIHLLQNRLRSYDAVVHYHIDPSVHDKMTLSQIKPLLDHVIEVENDGTCWIE